MWKKKKKNKKNYTQVTYYIKRDAAPWLMGFWVANLRHGHSQFQLRFQFQPLLMQISEAASDGLRAWAPATHMGYLDGIWGSWSRNYLGHE